MPLPTIVIDLDDTLTIHERGVAYADMRPNEPVLQKLRDYRGQGFRVAIYTARNMKTHAKSVGKITALTLPIILEWLARHDVPYDEIYVGKPWPEDGGFYVDDRAIRPNEFINLSYQEIIALTGSDA